MKLERIKSIYEMECKMISREETSESSVKTSSLKEPVKLLYTD